jgi:hypothetical protein
MSKSFYLSRLTPGLLYLGIASAQYPIMDAVANRIIHGNTWFSPAYGAIGIYYRVVPTP